MLRACVVTGIFVLALSAPAHALSVERKPSEGKKKGSAETKMPQGWAWQAQRNGAPNLREASGIPRKDLAVAFFGGRDKLIYLGIIRASSSATLELKVDKEANNVNVETAELQACLILQEWEPAKPMAWDVKPLTDCDSTAPGSYDKSAKSFSFDLTPLARALASPAAHGVSIEPVDEPKSNFQVVFKGGKSVSVQKTPSRGGASFVPPGGSSSGNGDVIGAPALDFSGSSGAASAPPFSGGPAPMGARGALGSNVEAPVAVPNAAPAAAEQEPATFLWVYSALVAVAAFPVITRVLAYTLPKRTSKGKRR